MSVGINSRLAILTWRENGQRLLLLLGSNLSDAHVGRQGSREIDLCDRAASDYVSCRESHDITRCPGTRYTTASFFWPARRKT